MTHSGRADDSRRPMGPRTRSAAGLFARSAWLGCSLWLAVARPARAQEPELALQWDAPDSCADREAIQRRVEALLGRPLGTQSDPGLTARGEVAETEGGYTLMLETLEPQGRHGRTLSAPACETLVEAAALVLALALDPERAAPPQHAQVRPAETATTPPDEPESTPPDEPESRPARPSKTATTPPDEPESSPARSKTTQPDADGGLSRPEPPTSRSREHGPVGVSVGAGAALDWGSLPSASPGVQGTLALTRGRIRLQLTGTYWPDRPAEQGGASAQVGLYALGTSACVRAAGTVVSLWPCLGAEGGRMRAEGGEALLEREQHHPAWAAGLIGLRAAWQATRWLSLNLSAGMAVILTRPRFRVDEPGEEGSFVLHRASPVALRASLSSELTF